MKLFNSFRNRNNSRRRSLGSRNPYRTHRSTRRPRLEPLEERTLLASVPTIYLDPQYDTGRSSTDCVVQELDDSGIVVSDSMMSMFAMMWTIVEGPTLLEDGGTPMYQDGRHAYSAQAIMQSNQQFASTGGGMYDNMTVMPQYIVWSNTLIITIDGEEPDAPDAPDLLDSSDSGTYNDDNVTNVRTPSFQGTAEPEAIIRIYANGELVGEELVGFSGEWEVTVEPLVDGVYEITATQEDLAGNVSDESEALKIEIDTYAPNTPFLDLIEADDHGRHDDDNVTNVNEPTFTMTTDDPNLGFHNEFKDDQEYLKFRLFDRLEESDEILLYDSAQDNDIGGSDGFTNLTLLREQITQQVGSALADGIHNLKLEVEDRAGNISEDFLLDLLVDTVAPPVSFIGIEPGEIDTGVTGYTDTTVDRVTSYTPTRFVGRAEADAIVRLYVDANANDQIDTPAHYSLTVALPYDGDDALPDGQWEATYIYDLNNSKFFPRDGVREILVTAEDLAGNVNQVDDEEGEEDGDAEQIIDVFIDTIGPRVTDVEINARYDPYDLFDPKPSTDGPTPVVDSLVISVEDLPARSDVDPNFLYDALFKQVAEEPGHYVLVGDANGVIPILDVTFDPDPEVDGQTATGIITLLFWSPGPDGVFYTSDDLGAPLPDDRFTLTLSDTLVDPVGNALDGETNTIEPHESPLFPSGDLQPGGDFVARFTIDSRPEIGTWSAGSVYVDTNGNFVFDPRNLDYTNRDITYTLGFTSDDVFAGNFAAKASDTADGFDKLAVYGLVDDSYRWMVDTDNDGVPNVIVNDPENINGLPVAGEFDGNPANGDEVGLFDGKNWWFDTNHDWQVDTPLRSDLKGYPIVGDFDGNGADDLGTWSDDTFYLDLDSDGYEDVRFGFGFIAVRERPVAADRDQDGIDDLGLWVPDRSGMSPEEGGEWYLLISDGRSILDRLVPDPRDPGKNIINFTPIPFGEDIYAQYGDEFAIPVIGNFDPPVAGEGGSGAGVVRLTGTSGDDLFQCTPGSTPGSWIIRVNDAVHYMDAETIAVELDGLGGHDYVTLTGTDGDDLAKLWPDHGTLTGVGYTVSVANVESTTVNGQGGTDTAMLYDSAGNDTLVATPEYARLSGAGFDNQAVGFRYVHAYSQAGGTDEAMLYDSPGDDGFRGTPECSKLYGDDFYNRVKSFRYVHAYSAGGGEDVAMLYDSPGDDLFHGTPECSKLYGDAFYNRVKSFRYVHAYATAGGKDVAKLYDSAGNDTFVGTAEYAKLYGDAFYNRVKSFREVRAYATAGGVDTARLYDSGGDDVYVGTPDYDKLYGDDFFNYASSFEQVHVHATAGGTDTAELYDAVLESGKVRPSDSALIDRLARLYEFERILQKSSSSEEGETTVDVIDEIYTAYWQ